MSLFCLIYSFWIHIGVINIVLLNSFVLSIFLRCTFSRNPFWYLQTFHTGVSQEKPQKLPDPLISLSAYIDDVRLLNNYMFGDFVDRTCPIEMFRYHVCSIFIRTIRVC